MAVDEVTFAIQPGMFLAIVGESGSGKTTVARMVAGLERPSSGKILVDGVERTPLPWLRRDRLACARQVQMVFQDPNSSLDPSQTIEQSLAEVVALHGSDQTQAVDDRIERLLGHVGLDSRQRRMRPRRLSGGERQRAAIARALAVESRLLILDEAVSALDVSVQAHVLNLLCRLRLELGLTYIFISHDLAVVRQVSNHVASRTRRGTGDDRKRPSRSPTPLHALAPACRARPRLEAATTKVRGVVATV